MEDPNLLEKYFYESGLNNLKFGEELLLFLSPWELADNHYTIFYSPHPNMTTALLGAGIIFVLFHFWSRFNQEKQRIRN